MNVAAEVAREKADHPERFCPHPRCLWRTGGTHCPRHQIDPVPKKTKPYLMRRVKQASRQREIADAHYLTTIEEAHAAGVSYAELGAMLGITRQAVRQYVERGRTK